MQANIVELTRDQMLDAIGAPEVREQVEKWLGQGLKIAVYENHDMGHPQLGHKQMLSYGGPDSTFQEPPERLPDTPTQINWRYVLIGVYTGKSLASPTAKRSMTKVVQISDIKACPHMILEGSHYRDDGGKCRCDDPTHTEMQGWGYTWNTRRNRWV